MAERPSAVILHNRVPEGAAPDDADVLAQADAVAGVMTGLGYEVHRLAVGLDLMALARELQAARPQLVFNLVESLGGSGRLIHVVPALLECLGLPFTGVPADGMYLTTAKLIAKVWMRAHDIATPDWCSDDRAAAADPSTPWIVKSVWEDASLGLDDESVVRGGKPVSLRLAASRARWGGDWFAERFVEGREINVSLIASQGAPQVLPPAEIYFRDFPAGKPQVVGYPAKWDESSFEYCNTVRQFVDERQEPSLCESLRGIAARCWEIFRLRGYARVDFRVDNAGQPWVLEVNANPCLSADAGFAAALAQAGISFEDGIARIITHSSLVTGPRVAD
jgi:D-alanine-D-alanine ligase